MPNLKSKLVVQVSDFAIVCFLPVVFCHYSIKLHMFTIFKLSGDYKLKHRKIIIIIDLNAYSTNKLIWLEQNLSIGYSSRSLPIVILDF